MRTILLIEDDHKLRRKTKTILEMENYRVVEASNGKVGLELAQTLLPDLILCDIMMPDMDGYEVLQHLRSIPALAQRPFLFLTALSDYNAMREGMKLGADDYITKPFDYNELIQAIESRIKKFASIKARPTSNPANLIDGDKLIDMLSQDTKNALKQIHDEASQLLQNPSELTPETLQSSLQNILDLSQKHFELLESILPK